MTGNPGTPAKARARARAKESMPPNLKVKLLMQENLPMVANQRAKAKVAMEAQPPTAMTTLAEGVQGTRARQGPLPSMAREKATPMGGVDHSMANNPSKPNQHISTTTPMSAGHARRQDDPSSMTSRPVPIPGMHSTTGPRAKNDSTLERDPKARGRAKEPAPIMCKQRAVMMVVHNPLARPASRGAITGAGVPR